MDNVQALDLLSAGITLVPKSIIVTLVSIQKHKQFFSKNTDTNLSALFAFFRVANKVKSALSAQKQGF
jgi:hypothetical protein